MPDRPDFWSRRRRAVAAEDAPAKADVPAAEPPGPQGEAPAFEGRSDDDILALLGLPSPETLTPADAARFLAREIPAHLRRRAFRSLFRNHAHLSMPDGLQDYDHDFTDAAVNIRPERQIWNAGDRLATLTRDAAAAADRMPEPPHEGPLDPAPDAALAAHDAAAMPAQEGAGDPGRDARTEDVPTDDAGIGDEPAEDPHAEDAEPPRPRRMTFRFEETGP